MTPIRRDSLLAGQTAVAQKVYAAVPIRSTFTVGEIAAALKKQSGAGLDIRTLRGCLGRLAEAGLVREPVPGSFRRVEIKEKDQTSMPDMSDTPVPALCPEPLFRQQRRQDPIDIWTGISAKLRALADEIDAAALSTGEVSQATAAELEKFRQLKALLKDAG
ncbi:hypothetical protein [Pigmentiphaga kullae]|uniref:Uncharacterized protein n=1 Tax=Pigmentiphaga kullae TaxID=151784 RepID=A0A4Q7NCF9_9BURK|nr:hypothetical protein [Pigmentiphaga kullae]RZS80635.1 hypothetical protein EV675_3247 [Pigmentiphaga kullae]